ncbi:GNAT family N-acetyltransferase [Chitinimonas sp.]|uniref:GNAT family N-acetyltransferase n=1 Tax=Chitinimonas sp. TaxID=1934313 RepID=UPI0035B0B822
MQPASTPILNLAGIRLRPIARSDMADWYGYLQDPQAIEHTSWKLSGIDDLAPLFDSFESSAPTSMLRFAIANAEDRLIGTIGFHTVSPLYQHGELAYDLAPAYWGRGIAPAACRQVCDWAFRELGWVRIHAHVLDSNAASRRVLEKCGFRHEGRLHDLRPVRGELRNFDLYALLRRHWQG